MKFWIPLVIGLAVLAGCGSSPDQSKIGTLDFYDWLEMRLVEYSVALDGGNPDTQAHLEQAIRFQVAKRYDAIVRRAETEQDPGIRALAVSALGFSQRHEAVAHLEKHLDDPMPKIRGTAAAGIAILDPPQFPQARIEALLNEPDPYVRQAALFAIKLLCGPDRRPSVEAIARIEALARDDADPGIRNEAVWALGSIRSESSIDLLSRTCLVDQNALVRGNAAQALAGYGDKARSAVPFLIDRLKDGETGVVERAHYALKAITGRVDADRQYGDWADWLSEISKVLEYHCARDNYVSSAPGPCPTCGMVMEARAIPEAEFVCPEHKDVVSQKPGKCDKCGKAMHPRKRESSK